MSTPTRSAVSTPVTETLNKHVSVRSFKDEPISDDMLRAVLNAARRSPTSSNTQTYSMVVVRDPEKKKELAVLAGNQRHIEACDVWIGLCADIHRMAIACEMHGTTLARNLELSLVATIDAALVGMSLMTAAESFGLGGVMIGGMRNQPREAAALLGLPDGVYIVYGMSLGWPDWEKVPAQKPRMAEELIIHYERYDGDREKTEAGLRRYDADLAAHYGLQERNLDQAAWTGLIANRFSDPPRPFLRETLMEMGFGLE